MPATPRRKDSKADRQPHDVLCEDDSERTTEHEDRSERECERIERHHRSLLGGTGQPGGMMPSRPVARVPPPSRSISPLSKIMRSRWKNDISYWPVCVSAFVGHCSAHRPQKAAL